MSGGRSIYPHPYELIDLPSGRVLASNDFLDELAHGAVREVLEREGRARAETLLVRGGYYFEDGSPVHPDLETFTGDELAAYALSDPYPLDIEPPVGLDPHPFNGAAYEALPECKLELWSGGLFDGGRGRATIARALLADMGLRAIVKLAPRELWLAALEEQT